MNDDISSGTRELGHGVPANTVGAASHQICVAGQVSAYAAISHDCFSAMRNLISQVCGTVVDRHLPLPHRAVGPSTFGNAGRERLVWAQTLADTLASDGECHAEGRFC